MLPVAEMYVEFAGQHSFEQPFDELFSQSAGAAQFAFAGGNEFVQIFVVDVRERFS